MTHFSTLVFYVLLLCKKLINAVTITTYIITQAKAQPRYNNKLRHL